MKLLRRILFVAAGAACFIVGMGFFGVTREAAALDPASLPDQDFLPEITDLMASGSFTEAEELCCAVIGMNLPNARSAGVKLRECRRERSRWGVNAAEAVRGFVTGEAENAAGTAGAILSDLFLYGDLRDLGIQFARKLRGLPADTTLAVMAGIGVVTEISGLGKWAPSVLKQLRRAGALSAGLLDHLRDGLLYFRRNGKLSPSGRRLFGNLFETVNFYGTQRAKTVLRSVRTPAELSVVAKLRKRAPEVPWLLTRSGKRAGVVQMVRFSGDAAGERLLKSAARKGRRGVTQLEKIRVVKWAAKNIHTGRFRAMLLYRAVASPEFRKALNVGGFFCLGLGVLLAGWGCRFNAGRVLSFLRGKRSETADAS